jgi:hypothetical protein
MFNEGDTVTLTTHTWGTEWGTYRQRLGFRPDMHEVWAHGNPSMARVVHTDSIEPLPLTTEDHA